MEIERRRAGVPAELVDFLRANPTPQPAGEQGKQEIHLHFHAAPSEPIPAGHIVRQGPEKSVAERIIPWLGVTLLACIVLTLCAAVLTVMMLIVVATLGGLALLGLVVAYIINSQAGAVAARGKAALDEAKAAAMQGKHKRR